MVLHRYDLTPTSLSTSTLTGLPSRTGFEGVIDMGEEAKDARRSVPKAVMGGIIANGVLGFLMVVTFIVRVTPSEPQHPCYPRSTD